MAVVLGVGLVASGESYYLKSATNMPPWPFNPRPGYPTTTVNGVTIGPTGWQMENGRAT